MSSEKIIEAVKKFLNESKQRSNVRIYKIGDKMIDLQKLIAIGDVNNNYDDSRQVGIALYFEGGSNMAAMFEWNEVETKRDFLEYVGNERLKLIATWTQQ